jgi:hypothetical protein
MTYTATAEHNGLKFTGTGNTDHAAVTAAMKALEAVWSIDTHRARLTVRFGDSIQYVTTASRYAIDTN